jgi:hypothetical protein
MPSIRKLSMVCTLAAAAACALGAIPAEDKAAARERLAAADRAYRKTKGDWDERRVSPARYFDSLRKLMDARLEVCETDDGRAGVIKEFLAIAAREFAKEESDLEGSRPYERDLTYRYAVRFLMDCGLRLDRLSVSKEGPGQ